MATTTTRYGLRKPDLVDQSNVETDLGGNFDIVDTKLGAQRVASNARPATPPEGDLIHETDTGGLVTRLGGAWSHVGLPRVAAVSEVVAPYTGMLVYDTVQRAVLRYDGAAWVLCLDAGNTSGTIRGCRYKATVNQTTNNNVETAMAFDTAVYTSVDIIKDAAHTSYTLNRAGLWMVSATNRWPAYGGTNAAGERKLIFALGGVHRKSSTDHVGSADPSTQQVRDTFRATAGQVVQIRLLQTNTGALARATDTGFGGYNVLNLTWLRP